MTNLRHTGKPQEHHYMKFVHTFSLRRSGKDMLEHAKGGGLPDPQQET